jgi:hypothetical protein
VPRLGQTIRPVNGSWVRLKVLHFDTFTLKPFFNAHIYILRPSLFNLYEQKTGIHFMEDINVKPGDIIVTNYGTYQHWSLVSDRIGSDNKLMLISATKRLGTVAEELWDTVVKGKTTYVVDAQFEAPTRAVLERARSQIGKWKYELTSNNCEHFVKWSAGIEVSSTQVKAFGTGALLGVAGVAAFSDDPKLIKFLGGALLLGGIAVMAAKAIEKPANKEYEETVV